MRRWLEQGYGYVVVQLLLFAVIFLAPGKMGWEWSPTLTTLGQFTGGAFMLYGILMLASALVNLGKNFQVQPNPKENASLVTNGVYQWVRHPMYSGIILGWSGWGAFHSEEFTILLVCVLLIPFFTVKSHREEKLLTEAFSEYPDYKTRVCRLIPFIF